MYRLGDLELTVPKVSPECEETYCVECGANHGLYDSRTSDYRTSVGAFLPHSCNEWFIGGVEQIDALIEDLQVARSLLLNETADLPENWNSFLGKKQ